MMTREQHLAFCKKCTQREMDLKQGIVCALTKEKANFVNECKDYQVDADYIERFDDAELLENHDVRTLLNEKTLAELRKEQNYILALIIGSAVGLIGSLLWAAITIATEYQIGYMAIAIGAGVGFSIRYAGKGIDQIFGITGAIIAVLSCLFGNFFSIIGFLANEEGVGYLQIILALDYSFIFSVMTETFSFIDIFFYGLAGYEGYKFAFRTFTEKEIAVLNDEKDGETLKS